ncbi:hypothetical protein [Azovibrio restrictus]|uniref:hypothetical protein n=1 Tax=Azovibrio restrictus TaxID=146938 RepID=UPI0026F2D695|nr:hypothetical protein [Azovibrio restrictus]MDD3481427.1 hypothetical protein [Azovibrio restrictus]
MFRKFRILILLFILAAVGVEAWRAHDRTTGWDRTVNIGIYPIAADDSPATAQYLRNLDPDSFKEIKQWLQEQARDYGQGQSEVADIWLAPTVQDKPPLPPLPASILEAMLWSLKLRWWASDYSHIGKMKPLIRLFVLYHDPNRTPALPHSTGLEKGKIAIIHAFASRQQHRQNAVIITHELLHTFGATDKYDMATLQPRYPDGYAEPEQNPLHPQQQAEIMGGRTPISPSQAEIPDGLWQTMIGPMTAREIGLLNTKK